MYVHSEIRIKNKLQMTELQMYRTISKEIVLLDSQRNKSFESLTEGIKNSWYPPTKKLQEVR